MWGIWGTDRDEELHRLNPLHHIFIIVYTLRCLHVNILLTYSPYYMFHSKVA